MSAMPMIFFSLLADANLTPAAVKLHIGEGDSSALIPIIANEDYSTFSSCFPCLIDSDLAEKIPHELLEIFENSGTNRIQESSFQHSDASEKPVVQPATPWLIGSWFLASPPKSTAKQSASRALSLKLMQLVATDADTCEIEAIFRQDPVLAYHLLRLVNSLGMGTGRTISSFAQAILILGRQQLKRWLNLMLFAASHEDYRSAMLVARVAVRARTMELLAKAIGLDRWQQEQAFMAGMFSLLGVLFGMPLTEIIGPLKLGEQLSNALLRHESMIGRLLYCVELSERLDEVAVRELLAFNNLTPTDWNHLTLEAHQWMLGAIHDKQDSADG